MTVTFAAPGPGPWEQDAVHFPRPTSRLAQGAIKKGFAKGFAESTARYGLMLSHFQPAFVNDFYYSQVVPFGAPPGAKGPPPKPVFWLVTRLVPKVRARIAVCREAMDTKAWREDLKLWDEEKKPKADAKHKRLQSVDLRALDDAALADHFGECNENCGDMVYQHHRFTISCCIPVGDLLAHVAEWTGKSAGEILHVVRGASPISRGAAYEELDALVAALGDDAAGKALLDAGDAPDVVLQRLTDAPGRVGEAARAYLDVVRHRSLGYDVTAPAAGELPESLLRSIRAAASGQGKAKPPTAEADIKALRDAVPKEHRASFDELLEEARNIYRLRDERGHHSDGWAAGVARRATHEVARRLHERGDLPRKELAFDAEAAEIDRWVRGAKIQKDELADLERRFQWRTTKSASDPDVPRFLNGEPGAPPPVDWLPPAARRGARATEAVINAIFQEPPAPPKDVVKGLPVSPGVYEGPARLVSLEDDFGRIQQGDVLVTRATAPYFNVVLPLLGAIVTDRGGQLCHAAIVSREYGIPGVVGTMHATQKIKDGQRVRVDGSTGEVTVVG